MTEILTEININNTLETLEQKAIEAIDVSKTDILDLLKETPIKISYVDKNKSTKEVSKTLSEISDAFDQYSTIKDGKLTINDNAPDWFKGLLDSKDLIFLAETLIKKFTDIDISGEVATLKTKISLKKLKEKINKGADNANEQFKISLKQDYFPGKDLNKIKEIILKDVNSYKSDKVKGKVLSFLKNGTDIKGLQQYLWDQNEGKIIDRNGKEHSMNSFTANGWDGEFGPGVCYAIAGKTITDRPEETSKKADDPESRKNVVKQNPKTNTEDKTNDGWQTWEGKHTYTHENGDQYIGNFKAGKFDGKGTLTWKGSGNTYIGDWKEDKMNGNGIFTIKGKKYEGKWENDCFIDGNEKKHYLYLTDANKYNIDGTEKNANTDNNKKNNAKIAVKNGPEEEGWETVENDTTINLDSIKKLLQGSDLKSHISTFNSEYIQDLKYNKDKDMYKCGDLLIKKSGGYRNIDLRKGSDTKYFKKSIEVVTLKVNGKTSINQIHSLIMLLHTIGSFSIGKEVGTDNFDDIDRDDFGKKGFTDDNPFFVGDGDDTLHLSSGASRDDYDIITKKSLDKLCPGTNMKDIAKFLTAYSDYVFDDDK